jgi:hypothetical protein
MGRHTGFPQADTLRRMIGWCRRLLAPGT